MDQDENQEDDQPQISTMTATWLVMLAVFDDALNLISDAVAATGFGLVVYFAIRITTFFISAIFLTYFIWKFKWNYLGMGRGAGLIISAFFDEIGIPTRTITIIILIMSLKNQAVGGAVQALGGKAGTGLLSEGKQLGSSLSIEERADIRNRSQELAKQKFKESGLSEDFAENIGSLNEKAQDEFSQSGIAQRFLKETPGTKYGEIVASQNPATQGPEVKGNELDLRNAA